MLGLSSSIPYTQVPTDPSGISDLVLWYDFTKSDTLRQDRDGTGTVSANNDPVEWARNLANGDANGNVLGAFARSEASGSQYGGTFKTGGAGGQSYLQFDSDGTEQDRGLRSGFITADATDDGGVASDKFSDVTINVSNVTIIQILKHDDAVIEEDDNSFFIQGHPAVGGNTNSFQYIGAKSQSLEKFITQYVVTAGGIDLEGSTANDTLDTNVHAMVMRATPGTNNMTMQVDGVVQTDTDTPDDRTMKFDRSTGVTTNLAGAAIVGIGSAYTSGSAGIRPWRGAIYETLIYSRFITDEELASLEVYFGQKYGITFS